MSFSGKLYPTLAMIFGVESKHYSVLDIGSSQKTCGIACCWLRYIQL